MKLNTKHLRLITLFAAVAIVFIMSPPASSQLGPSIGTTYGGSNPNSKKVVSGIAWYGVLQDGLNEAKRTGKPILFITAAAQCNGIPGMW